MTYKMVFLPLLLLLLFSPTNAEDIMFAKIDGFIPPPTHIYV